MIRRPRSLAGLRPAFGRSLTAVALAVAASVPSSARQGPAAQAGSEPVEIGVRVIDRNGQPVVGLTAADFSVAIDDMSVPVGTAQYVPFTTVGEPAAAGRAAEGAGAPVDRSIAILVDDLSFDGAAARPLLDGVARWLARLGARDRVALDTTSGYGRSIPLTDDRARVSAVLRAGLAGRFPESPFRDRVRLQDLWRFGLDDAAPCGVSDSPCQAIAALGRGGAEWRARVELASLRQVDSVLGLVRRMQAAPGEGIVLLVSNGLIFDAGSDELAALRQAVGQSGAATYILTPDVEARAPAPEPRGANDRFLQDGLVRLGNATGAVTLRVGAAPDEALASILTDVSGTYRLLVDAAAVRRIQPFGRVVVSVARTDISVRTPARIRLAAPPQAPAPTDRRLQEILTAREPADPLALESTVAVTRDQAEGQVRVTMALAAPAQAAGPLTVTFVVLDAGGQEVRGGRADVAAAGGMHRAAMAISLPVGRYRVRLAAADATGTIGLTEQHVVARLRPIAAFTGGDLEVAWRTEDSAWQAAGSARLPPEARTLGAALDLLAGTPAAQAPKVSMVLTTAAGQPIGTQNLTTAPFEGGWRMTGTVVLDPLDAGMYDVTLRVGEGTPEAAFVTRRFEKTSFARAPAGGTRGPATPVAGETVLSMLQSDVRQGWPRFDANAVLTVAALRRHITEFAREAGVDVPPALASAGDIEWWPAIDATAAGSGPMAEFCRTIAALRRGDGPAASAAARRALISAPASLSAALVGGAAEALAGRPVDAMDTWEPVLGQADVGVEWRLAVADAQARSGDVEGALKTVRSAGASGAPGSFERAVDALIVLGRFAEARREIDNGLRRFDTDRNRLLLLDVAFKYADALAAGAPATARSAFEAAARRYIDEQWSASPMVQGWLVSLAR